VFNGPAPEIETFDDPEQEAEAVCAWITGRVEQGVQPHEIGVFVRSTRELRRVRAMVKRAGVPAIELSDKIEITPGKLSIGTMHLAKGLEFRAVAVMACDDEIIPSQERIENVADDADLEVVYDTERHLLYVACTRARDHLLVTGVKPASEFLEDLLH
jgi:superfamily I DNA/RNA helicase